MKRISGMTLIKIVALLLVLGVLGTSCAGSRHGCPGTTGKYYKVGY